MEIVSIVYQKELSNREERRYNRIPADCVNLIAGHGIEGDRKAGKSKKRQLNVMDLEMVQTLKREGYQTAPGQLGEQIVLSGVRIAELAYGTKIQLGESAIIELLALREPCEWFEEIQDKTMEETEGRVGRMARVLESGVIRVGDSIKILIGEPA